jgi:hypothetical protein
MTRQEAIEIARECAKAKPQSYYTEPFQPHEWVVDAIMRAAAEESTRMLSSLVAYSDAQRIR